MGKRKREKQAPAPSPTVGTSLGDLLAAQGLVASKEEGRGQDERSEPPATAAEGPRRTGKVALHLERKGRGGRSATRVSGLDAGEDLEALARSLRRSLGCGASVDGDELVVQGRPGERLVTWVRELGYTRVVGG